MPLRKRSQFRLKCKGLTQKLILIGVERKRYHGRIHAMEWKRGIDKRGAKKTKNIYLHHNLA